MAILKPAVAGEALSDAALIRAGQKVIPISAPMTSALGIRPVPLGRMTHWMSGWMNANLVS